MANINVTVQGGAAVNAQVGENTLAAANSATLAQSWAEGTLPGGSGTKSALEWADDAAQSAAYAGGFETPEFDSQSEGNAGTTAGQIFRVPIGTTPQTFNWFRRLSSGSEAVSPLATTAVMAASGGDALVGTTHGGTAAVTRTQQARNRERIHVTDYPSLAQAIAAAPAGAEIWCPAGYTHTVTSTISISKDVTIRGANWRGVTITGPANAPIFEGVGGAGVTNFVLEGITWIGGAGTSQLLRVTTSNAWFEGRTIIRGCKINNFGAFAIERQDSTYFTEIRGNRFDNCVGSISEGWASDSVIDDNLFNDMMAGNPCIRIVGGSRTVITSNGFIRATGTITEADIEFNPTTSFGRGGRVFVLHNKFGGEGETPGRPKIRVFNATAANRSTDVVVAFNQLHGEGAATTPTGTTFCFEFLNPIAGWDVFGNEFDDFDLIVKDSTAKFDGILVTNTWGRNRYFWSRRRNGKLFENGGAQFTEIDENVFGYQPLTHSYEPREARNRLWNSTAIDLWNKSSGVTITTGQADPDGGTSAFLIESDGTAGGQHIFRSITITGMGSSVVVRFRAKAEDSTKIVAGMRDSASPSGWIGMLQNIVLDNQWREYRFVLNGLNPANAHQLYFYPADTIASRAGGFFLYQPQVSDHVSDFVPTPTGAGVAVTDVGRRFQKRVLLAGGVRATLPVFADNAAAAAGGLVVDEVYRTATGEVRVRV
jgi:hypothetical protein